MFIDQSDKVRQRGLVVVDFNNKSGLRGRVISQQNIIITMSSDQKARSSFVSVKWIIMAVVQVTHGIQGSSWSPFSPVSQEFPLTRASRAIPPSTWFCIPAPLVPLGPHWPASVAKEVLTMGEN